MNVAGQGLQIGGRFDDNRLESALEQVAGALMSAIVVGRVADIEPLNRPAEVGFRRLEDQMVVVRHDAIAVYNDRILSGHTPTIASSVALPILNI